MRKTMKTFNVCAEVKVEVNLKIEASSYQDALNKAKELDILDFVDIKGDYNDGELLGICYIGSDGPSKLLE